MEKNIKLGTDFVRFQYYPHLLVVVIFCLVSGCFVSFRNLDLGQSAKVLEMYVGLVGALLMTPLFMAEQDVEIWQLEKSRQTPMWQLYLIRVVLAVIGIVVVVTVFLEIMQNNHSAVQFPDMWIGGVSELLFLGSIGAFVSAVTNQVILGYMASVMYYAVNIGGKNYFGPLALFQMSKGKYGFAGWMLLGTVILLISGIMIREIRSRN